MVDSQRLGRFVLDRRLAVGGMAEVFLAHREGPAGFEKVVLVKRVLPARAKNPRYISMLVSEARIAAMLRHPNLVEVFDFEEIDGQYCLSMEYIEGYDLRKVIARRLALGRHLPLPIAVWVVAQVAEGLHYAHEATDEEGKPLEVIHRDISPENILVTTRGGVKIVDFGLAKHRLSVRRTTAMTIMGKYAYMSPEQAAAEPLDRRSDIFSLGAVLYELVCLMPCFARANVRETLAAVADAQYDPVRGLREDVPIALEQIIRRMLTKHRKDRFGNAAEVVQSLGEWSASTLQATSADLMRVLGETFSGASESPTQRNSWLTADDVTVTDGLTNPSVVLDEAAQRRLMSGADIEDIDAGEGDVQESRRPRSWWSRLHDGPLAQRRAVRTRALVVTASVALAMSVGAIAWLTAGHESRITVSERDHGASTNAEVDARGFAMSAQREVTLSDLTESDVDSDPASDAPDRIDSVSAEGRAERPSKRSATPVNTPTEKSSHKPRLGQQHGDARSAPQPAASTSKKGILDFETDPATTVSLDGRRLGTTPLRNVDVSAGTHTLELQSPQFGFVKTLELSVRAGDRTRQHLVLRKGKVALDVKPWADVYVSGRKVGTTPLAPLWLYEGNYSIRLVNPDTGVEKKIQISVSPDAVVKISEQL